MVWSSGLVGVGAHVKGALAWHCEAVRARATVTTLTLPVPAQGSGKQSDHDAA